MSMSEFTLDARRATRILVGGRRMSTEGKLPSSIAQLLHVTYVQQQMIEALAQALQDLRVEAGLLPARFTTNPIVRDKLPAGFVQAEKPRVDDEDENGGDEDGDSPSAFGRL